MKIWIVSWQSEGDHPSGEVRDCFATEREAIARIKELAADPERFDCSQVYGLSRHHVPLRKAELLSWLNTQLNL